MQIKLLNKQSVHIRIDTHTYVSVCIEPNTYIHIQIQNVCVYFTQTHTTGYVILNT